MRKAYCDGPFGQIHYSIAGDGLPLILLHQSPTASVQFSMVMEFLVDRGIRPIAMDTPGFGMSDKPDFIPTIEDYAMAVIALIDSLSLESFHILGHHTGAQTATEVAIREPKKIKSLILNMPIIFTAEENTAFREESVPIEKKWKPEANGSHLQAVWDWRTQLAPGFLPRIMHRHVVQQLVHIDEGWYGHNAFLNYKHAEKLQQISQPTFLLCNNGSIFIEHARRALGINPEFQYKELDGGTIDFVEEQPEEWSDAVATFLKKV